MQDSLDVKFMTLALREAEKAGKRNEVPVGAILALDGRVIARGHNRKEFSVSQDPTAHAEIIALRRAAKKLKSWRMTKASLYVTLEPCLMCMGAIIQSRISRIVFAAFDPKAGACGSLYDVSNDLRLNHRVEVRSNVMEEESKKLLKGFFSALRKKRRPE
ncbi:MAG TPA: tRNA adenosine(34) deaminase TadA [Thermodesulfobacteriota bacterium]|nr:tRNA adenosine(34) deaminase TadA [Thermodesulfobacteriota bacterium]